jgi:hypothetical protein
MPGGGAGVGHLAFAAPPGVGIAMMEGHLRPLAGCDDFDDGGRELFQALRSSPDGEPMVLNDDDRPDQVSAALIDWIDGHDW